MTTTNNVVFLLDVDNTLLDNDREQNDLRAHLANRFATASRDRYWQIFHHTVTKISPRAGEPGMLVDIPRR